MQAAAVAPAPTPIPKVLLLWAAACCAATLAISISLWLFLGAAGPASERTLVIEPGTALAIERGYPVSQPANIDLEPGGTLTITNHDSVEHFVGWLRIPPGETASLTAPTSSSEDVQYSCSIHPAGTLAVSVGSGLALWQAIAGGLAAGLVMAGIASGVTLITRRLDLD